MSTYLERPLGEILHLELDDEPVEPERTYLTAGIYSHGRGLFKRPPIEGSETSYSKYTRLHAGQFVYSKLFGWEGAMAVVESEFDRLYVSQEFPTFRINTVLASPAYVNFLAQWYGLHFRLKDKGTGVGSRRQRVSVDRLLATPVPLPSRDEQDRVAARLESMFSKHSRFRELHARRTDLKIAFKESAINYAMNGAEEALPVKDLISLTRRQVFPEAERIYREIGIKSFGRGIFHKPPVTGGDLGEKRVFAIQPGDLVFSNVFAWEGAVALAGREEAGMIGSHRFMTYLTIDSVSDARYLKHYFTSSHGLDVIRRASPGSAGRNKTLGIKSFEGQVIPVPDIDTQRRIGEALDRADSSLMADDLKFLDAMKLSLLNAAFTGQL